MKNKRNLKIIYYLLDISKLSNIIINEKSINNRGW